MKRVLSILLVCILSLNAVFAVPTHDDYRPEDQLREYYEKWKNGNHFDEEGNPVESPGYVQLFQLPEIERLPGEAEGSDLGAVVVMVPNGTPDELPGDYCVSTDEAMGYGMIIAALMNDQELFDQLYRVVSYYDNFKYLDEDQTEALWNDHLTSWAIPAKPGKDWFETDYFKGLPEDVQEEWRTSGVQYDPLYKENTAIKESVIIGEPKNEDNCSGSAMDGELDIAYALYLAHNQFEDADTSFYLEAARKRFDTIFDQIIIPYGLHTHPNGEETLLLPTGDYFATYTVGETEMTAGLTRPCDWMLSHIRAYYNDTENPHALKLIEDTYEQANLIKNETTGFVADFYKWVPDGDRDKLEPAADDISHEWLSDHFYMNSARYPFRQAVDTLHYEDERGIALAKPILDYLIDLHGFEEESDFWSYPYAGYTLDGEPHEWTMWKNPPLNDGLYVTADTLNEDKYESFVNSGWGDMFYTFTSRYYDWSSNGLGFDPYHSGYFGDTWNLLGLLVLSDTWTAPEIHTFEDTWTPDTTYNKGDQVVYKGVKYVCRQDHTAFSHWRPNRVSSLWLRVKDEANVSQWHLQIKYQVGDLVEYKGIIYECKIGHTAINNWSPDKTNVLWNEK